ncbi:phage tail protein [Moraxella sp. Pampa]|uniref:phage tail protein n=1 Tax=Moraxella sp. Pampa TaxID=3111978 RepID=UPI002B4123DC|nr:phage tail protein [Moraxella sp. Pampa]
MMMIIGMFVFRISTAAYDQLVQKTQWRHASNSRVGTLPAYQFIGRGENTITLSGSIVPEFGNQKSLIKLSDMADTGRAYPLICGNGRVWGQYVIESISETHSIFFKNGTAKKVEFTIELKQISTPKTLKDNTLRAEGGAVIQGDGGFGEN